MILRELQRIEEAYNNVEAAKEVLFMDILISDNSFDIDRHYYVFTFSKIPS